MTALLCAARGPAAEPAWVRPDQAGQPLALALGQLRGDDFRLLPGVGPALAERLEAARIAAGGALHAADLDRVPGVGPVRAARWRALTDPKAPGPAGRVDAVR